MRLGPPALLGDWLDYRAWGLGDEHAAALLTFLDAAETLDPIEGDAVSGVPVHAWRALAQLGVPETLPCLLRLIDRSDENDFFTEDLPSAVELVGVPAFDPLADRVRNRSLGIFARSVAARALVHLCRVFPADRSRTGEFIAQTLSDPRETDPVLLGLLVSDLIALDGVEWALHIKAALASGRVGAWHCGDWEDVQVDLGLLDRRRTPPQYYVLEWVDDCDLPPGDDEPGPAP